MIVDPVSPFDQRISPLQLSARSVAVASGQMLPEGPAITGGVEIVSVTIVVAGSEVHPFMVQVAV